MNRELAGRCAALIHEAFDAYHRMFQQITLGAKSRFEKRDWPGAQEDAVRRLDLYKNSVDRVTAEMRQSHAELAHDRGFWVEVRDRYSTVIQSRSDVELCHTFFNSVCRRMMDTVGVDPEVEFLEEHFEERRSANPDNPIYQTYAGIPSSEDWIRGILRQKAFDVAYEDMERDVKRVADRIDAHLGRRDRGDGAAMPAVDVMRPVFYRNRGAYILGRIHAPSGPIPLVLAILNADRGVFVDAVLLTQDEASIVFSFTRSYFQVDAPIPHEVIQFLKTLMPLKPVAELYTAIGYNKFGKTELYRDLLRHFDASDDRFEPAPGEKGMVMVVFTLHAYDVVFKIIKDRFSYAKRTTKQQVKERYALVFKHDRAGRLIDAQEFENLVFQRGLFAPELLAELLDLAPGTVRAAGREVVIEHAYVERRVTPLNLYLCQAGEKDARDAVVDLGFAIKDLAGANIFPGDVLLKNFGVTRHGRVVFYDYDELCLLTDCHFREIPEAADEMDEMSAEPWFFVKERDVFPEEFGRFLGLDGPLRSAFDSWHRDLFTLEFWRKMQDRIRSGYVADFFPYKQVRRLKRIDENQNLRWSVGLAGPPAAWPARPVIVVGQSDRRRYTHLPIQSDTPAPELKDEYRSILDGIEKLPTLPAVVNRLLTMIESPKTSAEDVNRIIRMDQALTVRVLKIVNSAFYGFPRQVSTVTQAVVILGFNAVKSLALSASVIRIFENKSTEDFDIRAFWDHSICTGVMADMAGRRVNYPLPEECLIAGILHGMGKLVFDQFFHDEFIQAVKRARKERKALQVMERDIFGVDHCQIGVYLATRWKLPVHLVEAIRYYPTPALAVLNAPLVSLVNVGNFLARKQKYGDPGDSVNPSVSEDACKALRLTRTEINQMLASADEEMDKVDDLLDHLQD